MRKPKLKLTPYLLFGVLLFLSLSACGGKKSGAAKVRLSSNERALMDSLYIKQIEQLRPMWDSLCTANFETSVAQAVDSLITTRLEEEVRLRARINQQQ
ncbi:MAG: hypothetical protein HRU41_09215 [Saprospiraceae bacterium]|nr:hypothetical protein [Saprospiraceae bacterium]